MFPCPKTIGENFTCQYYRPAWQNRSDIKNVLEERMTRIRHNIETFWFVNFVVSMENMEKEMEYILTGAGVVNPISIMNKIRNATIRKVEKKNQNISYVDYWKRVPAKLIDKVRFYYRFEIFLFQYPETPFYIDNL
ncbi:hypothetical protein EB796_017923 [Bugula neritina]|uniref:Uncharacterized protein n=1 Tax=Bugula neritina TaxID=10212 RepID=A0A7J7JBW5_BUGNE|nr:hypothetical protein EB796_017923 [Bugula neritina]